MTSIMEKMEGNKRLVVLRAIAEAGGEMNETLISHTLALFGFGLNREEVRDLLKWLDERDTIDTRMANGVVMIATLTRRGRDHLEFRGPSIDGIDRPSER